LIDAEEHRLCKQFHALPLGISLWNYGFLTSDGELFETELEPNEITRTTNSSAVICAIAIAARRFPELNIFIPAQPKESIVCPMCQGTKTFPTDKSVHCPVCAGLGWRYNS